MTPRQLLRLLESRQPELFYDNYTPAEVLDAEINSDTLEDAVHYILSQLKNITGASDWKEQPLATINELAASADIVTVPALCTVAENVEDFVYINGPKISGVFDVRKADITDYSTLPSIGMITEKSSDTDATIQISGEVTVTNTLTPSKLIFIDTNARARVGVPPGPGERFAQRVGVSTGINTIQLASIPDITKLI